MIFNRQGVMIDNRVDELNESKIAKAIELFDFNGEHGKMHYEKLGLMYEGKHEILRDVKRVQENPYKPDNRLVVNFAKYLVDTFNGYFIGNPPTITHEDEVVNDTVAHFIRTNYMSDQFNEVSKISSIYGKGFLLTYRDENNELGVTYSTPENTFIVYDNTVQQRPQFSITYNWDETKSTLVGTAWTKTEMIEFTGSVGVVKITDRSYHGFGEIPLIEFIENEERQGVFENVVSLIDALNKALSNKANDVDYFADAYMYILGAVMRDEDVDLITKKRIINFTGMDADKIKIGFMEKPNADETQENLINRLIDLIFQVSMIANISDEDFGNTSSGISLEYKLQSMKNLAMNKERKFERGIREMFKMLSTGVMNQIVPAEQLHELNIAFNRNLPKNVENEIANAKNAEGIVSKQTQLELLSFIENPMKEIERIEDETSKQLETYSNMIDPYATTQEVTNDGEENSELL